MNAEKKKALTGLILVLGPAIWNFAQGFFGLHFPFSLDDILGSVLQGGGAALLAKTEKV